MKKYSIWHGRDCRFPVFVMVAEGATHTEAWENGMKDHWLKARPDLCTMRELTAEDIAKYNL